MNQLERNSSRTSSGNRSSSRGSDRNSRTSSVRSSSSRRSSYEYERGGSQRSSYQRTGRSNYSGARRNGPHRRRKGPDYRKIAILGVILLVLIVVISLMVKARGGHTGASETTEAATTQTEAEIKKEVRVDGITITGMTRTQAENAILKEYPWNMTVKYGDDSYAVANLMKEKVDALLDEIYGGDSREDYTLDTSGLEDAAAAEAAACASRWNKKAKNGSISGFDAASNKFTFAGEENGFAIDEKKLASDIVQALKDKKFDAVITAQGSEVTPEISEAAAKEKTKLMSSLTTNTTANQKRNTNVRLAAEALNGTIVLPGEEFSFNKAVGQRTEAKGYQAAAAYNNGEVVQEIGGGVCQISTTLYGAVYRAGLEISYRRSHTFEPTYITPGQDATVSWDQPDFKFINNSQSAIGIKASYSNQKATVSIYGIPILEEGVTWDLVSEKTETIDKPAPTYEEDQTLQPGVEVEKSSGTNGSRWVVYKVVYKNGKEVSREVEHKTTYKGHAPVIRRNTSGVVLNPEETTTVQETVIPTVDGMPEGYVPESTTAASGNAEPGNTAGSSGEVGPGVSSATAASPAPAATTAAATVAAPSATPEAPAADIPVIAPLGQ